MVTYVVVTYEKTTVHFYDLLAAMFCDGGQSHVIANAMGTIICTGRVAAGHARDALPFSNGSDGHGQEIIIPGTSMCSVRFLCGQQRCCTPAWQCAVNHDECRFGDASICGCTCTLSKLSSRHQTAHIRLTQDKSVRRSDWAGSLTM